MLLLAMPLGMNAQRFDALRPPNTYRNADNPNYWKNAPPFEGYWQQDVHYRIKARLNEKTDIASGNVELVYWNNSPDTLRWVFFHLYQNAYNAGSYASMTGGAQPAEALADTSKERGTIVQDLRADGTTLRTELDNTVLKAWLDTPLPPGGRVRFTCTFTTHWASDVWRRMKLVNAWGFKHYDGVHWYPRIAVYDRKFGWDTQQHMGNEFYGDFGAYDVDLDMPNDMVVEATGWLQNPNEVLPPDLRRRLDIANFQDKPWDERTTSRSRPTRPTGSAKRNGTASSAWPWPRNRTPAAGRTPPTTVRRRSVCTANSSACTCTRRWWWRTRRMAWNIRC
jgi:aminopeptidase N